MPGNILPAPPKKEITIIKAGSHWLFKHFFEDKQIFQELADYYDKDGYRFVLKTPGERNLVGKLLTRRGFAVTVVENSRLCGKIEPQEQILLAAQKLPRSDRDPGVAHIPDEGQGNGPGSHQTGSEAGRSGCAILISMSLWRHYLPDG